MAEIAITSLSVCLSVRAMSGPRPVVLSGPSGAGKSTLMKRLMKDHEGVFGFSVSRMFGCHLGIDLSTSELNNDDFILH